MTLPFYKRYPRDFIGGTVGMDLETKGAYSILLDLIYAHGGTLADDPRFIAGVLGCSVRKWNTIRERLISAEKIVAESGFISNFRASFELESVRKLSDKKAKNRAGSKKSNDLEKHPHARAHSTEPEPEPSVTSVTEERARKRASRLPEDWKLPTEWLADAYAVGMTMEQAHDQAERMRDWSLSASKGARLDWHAVWRNWCKRAADDLAKAGGRGGYADQQRASADAAQRASIRLVARSMGHVDDCQPGGHDPRLPSPDGHVRAG